MIGGFHRSSAPEARPSVLSDGLRALCKADTPRLARGLEAFVCRSTPGNQGARCQLQVRLGQELQGGVKLNLWGLSFPFGRVGTRADSAEGLGPAGPTRLQISPRGSATLARGRIVALGVWSARSPAAPWDAATPGRPSPAYPASVSTSAQWGRGLLCPAPVHPLPGKGPGGLGVVIGGVAGGVWVAGVSLLLGDRGGGALLF
jgi:hypothetical protein